MALIRSAAGTVKVSARDSDDSCMSNYNKQFERLKVIVVDDQDTIRKAISRALSQMGFREMEEFTDGR